MKCEECGRRTDRITRKQGEANFICAACRAKREARGRAQRLCAPVRG
ncbi:MAG: hypothetical protein AB1696_02295 [Planctomycetota bacterium]